MLHIRDLSVRIGAHEIVRIDELEIPHGRRVGLVGESGSGKTLTAMSLVGLQPRDAFLSGSVMFDGHELVGLSDRQLAQYRGQQIGVIFQDPSRALNPTMRVGKQVAEAIRLHSDLGRAQVRARVEELLTQVQLPDATTLARRYPHQLSGGQQQRVLIAIAVACRPKLLIADEPTTALDVTVQEEILDLIVDLSDQHDMSLLFVSHDLGVVRAVSHDLAVIYGGRLVETGPVDAVIDHSRHRYTEALIAANPGQAGADDLDTFLGKPLDTITGSVPAVGNFPSGCRFRNRCPHEVPDCSRDPRSEHAGVGHRYKCWNPAVSVGGELDGVAG